MHSKRIKVAMITNSMSINGISAVVMNDCKALDKTKFDLTIIAGRPIAAQYIEECKIHGIHVVELPSRRQDTVRYYYGLWKALKDAHCDIAHIHGNSSTMAIELFIAFANGVKARIAHCHACESANMRRHSALLPLFKRLYGKGIACSDLAGEWIFGKGNFEIITNGFHTKEYVYSEEKREKYRRQLKIEGKMVIGHVGRFDTNKNQRYVLRLFERIASMQKDAVLLLVGDGPDFSAIKEEIRAYECASKVIVYGETTDAAGMLCAMDIFVMPSMKEGLGLAAIEAQISGLPCIVSNTLPREVEIGNQIRFLPIGDENIDQWVEEITNTPIHTEHRRDFYEKNKESIQRFEIDACVAKLEQIYCAEVE